MAVKPAKLDAAIAAYLRMNGMTQAAFASKIGMSEGTLTAKRLGRRSFSFSEVIDIADLLGVSIDEIAPTAEEVRAAAARDARKE